MPTAYMVEASKTNRAVCKATDCKKNQVKIQKDELRFATLVEIKERQSWQWRHWGCVTPQVIGNVKTFIEGDFELLEGFETLPADLQAKIEKAVEQGHVDDEDWKGDPEYNRPGMKGFHARTSKKKQTGEETDDDDAEDSSPTKAAPKKRGRAKKEADEGEAEAPAPKKSRKKAKQEPVGSDGEAPAPKKPRPRAKKVKDEEPDMTNEEAAEEAPAKTKRARNTKKTKAPADDTENGDDDYTIEEAPAKPRKARASRKKADSLREDVQTADSKHEAEAEEAEAPAKPKRGRKNKTSADGDDEDGEAAAPPTRSKRGPKPKKAN